MENEKEHYKKEKNINSFKNMVLHFDLLLNQVLFHLSLKNFAHISNHLLTDGPKKVKPKSKFTGLTILDSDDDLGYQNTPKPDKKVAIAPPSSHANSLSNTLDVDGLNRQLHL